MNITDGGVIRRLTYNTVNSDNTDIAVIPLYFREGLIFNIGLKTMDTEATHSITYVPESY